MRRVTNAFLLLSIFFSGGSKAGSIVDGPYFGQTPPSRTPELFAPGLVSTGRQELGICFTPDSHEMYKNETSIQTAKDIEKPRHS